MAVYTDVSDDDLEAFLKRYDLGSVTAFKGIAEGVENSNFLLHTEKGRYILTLFEKRVKAEDLPFFVGLMQHYAAKGLACPRPVTDQHDQALGELCGRPALIVSFLNGVSLRRPQAHHCARLGQALAEFHLAGQDYALQRPNSLTLKDWPDLFNKIGARANSFSSGLSEMIGKELAYLKDNWPHGLPEGIIHADLFPDNVFFLKDRLSGFIDFYFACHDILLYDLAICMNAWCFEPDNAFNITKAQNLFQAYQNIRPLQELEKQSLPVLARAGALRFLLTRLYDWFATPDQALVQRKDPSEYLKKLQFHQSVNHFQDYGLLL
jgi:homoserine kinase type II